MAGQDLLAPQFQEIKGIFVVTLHGH